MAKKNKYDRQHLRNLSVYELRIDRIYQEAIREAAAIGAKIGSVRGDGIFSFSDYPATRTRVEWLMQTLKNRMQAVVVNGIDAEWTLSNNKNSELARQVFGKNVGRLSQSQYRRYFSTNDAARVAFQARRVGGLSLSDRVWNYTRQFKEEIELGLDVGIRSGRSAEEMSRDLRDYLKHPDKLFRRVRDEHGILQLSKRASEFHPGQGVYRSSYRNARRLASTETNIAYRTSDQERWKQFDFVVGIEVRLSNNHTCLGRDGKPHEFHDICDELAGRYPKDFKFTGWHPHCRCHAVSILKTQAEIAEDTRRILNGEQPLDYRTSENYVPDVPKDFNGWIDSNKERAKGWTSMPYFVKDNPQYVSGFEVDTYSADERKFTRATSVSPAMAESLGTYLASRYPEIPNTEKAALFHYTRGDTSAYRRLNNELRKGNPSEFNRAFSSLLSKALDKIEPVQETVYRTVRLNKTNLRAWVNQAEGQAETTFKGFTSTSLERSVIENMIQAKSGGRKNNESDVLLVIQSKSGRPIQDFSQFGGRFSGRQNQREVLFDKGLKVRFERVVQEGDRFVFYLSEV